MHGDWHNIEQRESCCGGATDGYDFFSSPFLKFSDSETNPSSVTRNEIWPFGRELLAARNVGSSMTLI